MYINVKKYLFVFLSLPAAPWPKLLDQSNLQRNNLDVCILVILFLMASYYTDNLIRNTKAVTVATKEIWNPMSRIVGA